MHQRPSVHKGTHTAANAKADTETDGVPNARTHTCSCSPARAHTGNTAFRVQLPSTTTCRCNTIKIIAAHSAAAGETAMAIAE